MKIMRRLFLLFALLLVLYLGASFYSGAEFGVSNPFQSIGGLLTLAWTDAEYTELQAEPRIILAESDGAFDRLIQLMKDEGYSYAEAEQVGNIATFRTREDRLRVQVSENRFASVWRFLPEE